MSYALLSSPLSWWFLSMIRNIPHSVFVSRLRPLVINQWYISDISTLEMKNRLKIPQKRPLADFLPTITITAKNLATEITNFNVGKEDLREERPITQEHVKNNTDVRKLLAKSGIKPEELPPEEDLKKLQRNAKSDEEKMAVFSRRKVQLE